jgi:hypothetical protein
VSKEKEDRRAESTERFSFEPRHCRCFRLERVDTLPERAAGKPLISQSPALNKPRNENEMSGKLTGRQMFQVHGPGTSQRLRHIDAIRWFGCGRSLGPRSARFPGAWLNDACAPSILSAHALYPFGLACMDGHRKAYGIHPGGGAKVWANRFSWRVRRTSAGRTIDLNTIAEWQWRHMVVSRIFRTFNQATAPVCITCGW